MYCIYGKASLFCILLAFSISVGTAHAYIDEDYSVMQKKSTGELIYVSGSTAESLVKRGYADPLTGLNESCVHVTDQDRNCNIVRSNQDELCFFSIDPQVCLVKFDKPENHYDCKRIYKFYALYQADSAWELEGFVSITYHIKSYDHFSFYYCDFDREPDVNTLEYLVTHDVSFIANQSIPSTLYCLLNFIDDSGNANEYYHCTFSSAKETFLASAKITGHPSVYLFNVSTEDDIEYFRSGGWLEGYKDDLQVGSVILSGGLCVRCE